jgi:hypothetical protein
MTTPHTDKDLAITLEEKVKRYIEIETRALEVLSIAVPENTLLYEFAKSSMEMIHSYFSDAMHFMENGDLINALSCLNYSYGWLDSGVRLGVFKTDGDYRKFTFYK